MSSPGDAAEPAPPPPDPQVVRREPPPSERPPRPVSYPRGPESSPRTGGFVKRNSDPAPAAALRPRTQVKPFTKESLERLERKTVQLVREYGFQPRRKLSVEDGSRLPAKFEPFPAKLYGRPLEEIDNFIYDETFCVVSKRFRKNYIHRFTATNSFFFFSPFSSVRKACIYLSTNQYFDYLVMATILLNCVFLAMAETIEEAEYIFLAIYTAEMIIKSIAKGFILNKYTYLRNPWNWLDFVVITSGYATIGMEVGNLAGLRTFRVLRALKTISILPVLFTCTMQRVLTLTVVLFIKITVSSRCDSFQNVTIKVHPDRGNPYDTTITGCIERIAFENVITEAHIKHQKIPKLGRDSVRNMKHLHTITFDNCEIKSIDPVAFRNVPNLKTIEILNGNLTYVSAGVFLLAPKLETLSLSHNKLRQIEDGTFSGVSNLKRLSCESNNLGIWRPQWFTNSTNLQIINFQFNKIKILPRRAFFELRKLEAIYFNYNELEVIQPEAFKGITHLKYLGLRYNRLKTIDPRSFPNVIMIDSLTIAANYLNAVSTKLWISVKTKNVNLDGNPWKCLCLDQVQLQLHEMNATVQTSDGCVSGDVPVCSFPAVHSTTCNETVDDDLTNTYFAELRKVNTPLDKYCARLD
ncbi:Sodium channel protein 60E-like Protein [Tribolium castaneum]|nr:Sodium channel protein 60E-like Protein [Tribolium castaneum]